MAYLSLILSLLVWVPMVWAEDVVRFDPSTGTYQGCQSIGNTNVFLTDPNDLKTARPGFLVVDPLTCQTASFAKIDSRYRKVETGQVVEMTQPEKDALDAPTPEQIKQAALQSEASANLYCTDDLSVIDAEVDKAKDLDALKEIVKTVARCARVK